MTQKMKLQRLTPIQLRREKQKTNFIADYKAMRKRYESEGVRPSIETLCRILSNKYKKSNITLRRYLKAEGEI